MENFETQVVLNGFVQSRLALYLRILVLMLHAPFGTDCFPLRLCQCLEREMPLLKTKPYKNALNLNISDCQTLQGFSCVPSVQFHCALVGESPLDGALHLDFFLSFIFAHAIINPGVWCLSCCVVAALNLRGVHMLWCIYFYYSF